MDYIRELAESAYNQGEELARVNLEHGFMYSDVTLKQTADILSNLASVRAAYLAGYYDVIDPTPRELITYVVKWIYDESPDLSFLGRYCQQPNHDKWIFDRKSGIIESPRGYRRNIGATWCRNEHRYIELENAYNFASAKFDAELLEAINDGRESVYGCIVTAVFNGAEIAHDSLWGIVAPSAEYRAEVEAEVKAEAEASAQLWLDSARKAL